VGTGTPRASSSRLEEADAAAAAPLPQLTLRELVAASVPDQEGPSRPTHTVAPGPIPEPAWMKRLLESGNEDDDDDDDDDENETWSDTVETDEAGDVRHGAPSFPFASISSSSASRVCTPSPPPSP
jgi:hypothetical protein